MVFKAWPSAAVEVDGVHPVEDRSRCAGVFVYQTYYTALENR